MTQSGQGPEPQYPARPTREGAALPAEGGAAGGQVAGAPWSGAWGPGGGRQGQPLPPESAPGAAGDLQATQYIPPVPPQPERPGPMPGAMPAASGTGSPADAYPPQGGYGYPQAPEGRQPQGGYGYPQAPADAYPPQGGYGYPQAPAAGASDLQATQYIPPVPGPGGGQPPFPGADPQQPHGHPQARPPADASDATQYMPPVPPRTSGERQPPAEFDNLFRSDATAHLPQPPAPHHQAPPQQPYQQAAYAPQQQLQQPSPFQGAYQDGYDDEPAPRRRSPVALIAAVVIGCAVVGLGAGALLSGGDDDTSKQPGQTVAATSDTPSPAPTEKAADPAEPQAKGLDKLLADSNSSRDAVIRSVESIKRCENLDEAANDLRDAAEQRRGLVTRLQTLSVDKLADHAELTSSLTEAWKASASADDHYAAWADQMKNKKQCKGGKARSTGETLAAGKASSEATVAKRKAAALWNPTAEKFGLATRNPTQL
ncbi:hypothetical protein OG393_13045 [Streptomyces sp. NBC_01216]|uniref:hypothetical protein n=1 Tax=Streptomyces sp. NBC_01216 TaxID=2903778 RepID=UPI002E133510|nr:hypothetical protein OG393_13045 [Streptomyces sp. NBC_01216]